MSTTLKIEKFTNAGEKVEKFLFEWPRLKQFDFLNILFQTNNMAYI